MSFETRLSTPAPPARSSSPVVPGGPSRARATESTGPLPTLLEHRVARKLPAALDAGALAVHYQPIVELPSGRILGAEALARWTDPELGAVSPEVFIPVAERLGVIGQLGALVLNEACREAAGWPRGSNGVAAAVSVNVSPDQLADDGIVAVVQAALTDSGLLPRRLCLEITESAAIEDLPACARRGEALRELGVRVALDDYGTGHSSLTMLRRLPVDVVKIDRTFVERVTTDALDAVLVRLVIDTAHSFGLRVCVEGVETEEQASQLVAMGADRGQGWLFGRPQPASPALTALLSGQAGPSTVDEAAPSLYLGGNDELVVVTTDNYRIRYISGSVKPMLGYVPAQAIGASVLDFLESRSDAPEVDSTQPLGNGVYRIKHVDGSTRWLRCRSQVLEDVAGRGREILFVAKDITEAEEAQRALAESEAKFREAFDGAPIGMAINRLDGSFIDVNHALAELLGYSTEQMMGMTVADLTCPDERANDTLNTEALLNGQVPHVTVDKHYVHASGRLLPVRVRASVVTDEGSGRAYIVAHVMPR